MYVLRPGTGWPRGTKRAKTHSLQWVLRGICTESLLQLGAIPIGTVCTSIYSGACNTARIWAPPPSALKRTQAFGGVPSVFHDGTQVKIV